MKRLGLILLTLLILNGCTESIEDGPFENNWHNGNLMERGTYKNGKLEGLYEYFFIDQSGLLYQRNSFKEGKCEGTFETFFQNGNLRYLGECVNGELQNISKSYYSDGSEDCLTEITNSKPHGTQECYFLNGGMRSLGNAKEGNREGIQEYFDPQGRLYLKEVWKNKKLVQVEHFNSLGEKVINGTIKLKHNNNRPYAKALIKDGHSQGMIFTYYEDGSIESYANYVNSLMEGTFRRFHLNGQLMFMSENKKGLQDGKSTQYALDGTILSEGVFKEGEFVIE
tara:strand:- start:57 stop:902 length:846 start_codon:yes stop_codon:yes gene_type:complete